MSAIEWLHFINPLIWIVLLLALLSSLPIPAAWQEEFKLSKQSFILKRAFKICVGLVGFGWLLAWLAPHSTTPIIRVNMEALSQLLLTCTLIALSILTITRIFQRNNFLSLLFILGKRYLPAVMHAAALFISGLTILFLDAANENREKQKEIDQEKVKEPSLDLYMNHRGDFCDKDKLNWF